MANPVYERVRKNPKFQELVSRRTRLATVLSLIVLVVYYGFMMVVAFNPTVLATPVSEGGTISIGFPIGAAIIIGSWLLTGYYVHRANGEFDELTAELAKEAAK